MSAFRDGARRVRGAPMMLIGLFAVTLLMALPLSYVLRTMLEEHLGASLAANAAAAGANYDWWQEFLSQASGLGKTFVPSIIGFGAVLDNLEGLLDNLPLASAILGITAAWLIVWSFLSGRHRRSPGARAQDPIAWLLRRVRNAFLAIAAAWRVAWLAYGFLFRYVHGWIFNGIVARLTHDVTVERTAFAYRVAGYLLFGALLVVVNIVFDYARIRLVVEDRRSAVGALLASGRFVRRHAAGVVGLYALNALAFLLLILIYAFAGSWSSRRQAVDGGGLRDR